MKHLLIIGARGWGREVYAAALGTKAYRDKEFDIKGFLDSKVDAFDGLRGNYPPIICAPEDYKIQKDDVFFVAMGVSYWRKHYAEIIEQKGGHFLTIVCNGAYINPTATIGEGSFVGGWSVISDNVKLGNHSIVHSFVTIGHDAKVGDYSTLEAYVFVGGKAEIGTSSTMHVRSTLIRLKSIGNNVDVGASSVVMRKMKDNQHVYGNPAREIEF